MTLTKDQEDWLKALESGMYKQTVAKLRDEFGYCCLGVACDVLNVTWTKDPLSGGLTEPTVYYNATSAAGDEIETMSSVLPGIYTRRLNMYGDSGDLDGPSSRAFQQFMQDKYGFFPEPSLAGYNDKGATHLQIATTIRAFPDAVFKPQTV